RVLITHHHADHVQALGDVRGNAVVYGPKGEASRIGGLDETLEHGATLTFGDLVVEAIATPGHTAHPLSYFVPEAGIAFTADTLFAMGCGRLFEGDAATMWTSLKKLRERLPDDTQVFCGHEYTLTNARFAHEALPDDPAIAERLGALRAAREKDEPTIPTTMALEKATNPFLRADDRSVAAALGMEGADPVDVFAKLRRGRDAF
ncbi:MAG: hydroxyacylglutathione hydrolase, partial [Pseudomonadota bacterium]